MPALFSKLPAETVRTYGLVLEASGIGHKVRPCGQLWSIEVPLQNRSAACQAISKYLDENKSDRGTYVPRPFPQGHTSFSAAYAVTPLVVIHWAIESSDAFRAFVASYGADASRIVSGSLYRCLTAMLLHSNWGHLLGNVVALALFGTALAYTTGWGAAWLFILLCGACGNLLTAFWYGGGHLSIGASTAVFAAVGLCAAISFWRGLRARVWSWRQLAPLAGGLALLGMLGSAQHTDLVAHMMGFGVGLLAGLLWGWKMSAARWSFQLAMGLLAVGLVILSWMWGMDYSA